MKKIVFWLSVLTGIGLLYMGACFFINPGSAETGYGIHINTNGDFSFQYIKGIRDFSYGLIILVFLWKKLLQALGFTLLLSTIIPVVDFCIIISHPDFTASHLYQHLVAAIICSGCGMYYLKNYKNYFDDTF